MVHSFSSYRFAHAYGTPKLPKHGDDRQTREEHLGAGDVAIVRFRRRFPKRSACIVEARCYCGQRPFSFGLSDEAWRARPEGDRGVKSSRNSRMLTALYRATKEHRDRFFQREGQAECAA